MFQSPGGRWNISLSTQWPGPPPTPPNSPKPKPTPRPPQPTTNGIRDELYDLDIPVPMGYDAQAEHEASRKRTEDTINLFQLSEDKRELCTRFNIHKPIKPPRPPPEAGGVKGPDGQFTWLCLGTGVLVRWRSHRTVVYRPFRALSVTEAEIRMERLSREYWVEAECRPLLDLKKAVLKAEQEQEDYQERQMEQWAVLRVAQENDEHMPALAILFDGICKVDTEDQDVVISNLYADAEDVRTWCEWLWIMEDAYREVARQLQLLETTCPLSEDTPSQPSDEDDWDSPGEFATSEHHPLEAWWKSELGSLGLGSATQLGSSKDELDFVQDWASEWSEAVTEDSEAIIIPADDEQTDVSQLEHDAAFLRRQQDELEHYSNKRQKTQHDGRTKADSARYLCERRRDLILRRGRFLGTTPADLGTERARPRFVRASSYEYLRNATKKTGWDWEQQRAAKVAAKIVELEVATKRSKEKQEEVSEETIQGQLSEEIRQAWAWEEDDQMQIKGDVADAVQLQLSEEMKRTLERAKVKQAQHEEERLAEEESTTEGIPYAKPAKGRWHRKRNTKRYAKRPRRKVSRRR